MRTADALLVAEGRAAVRDGRLVAVLRASGLRAADVALVAGVSDAAVCRWLAGSRRPSRESAIKIAKLLRALEAQAETGAVA